MTNKKFNPDTKYLLKLRISSLLLILLCAGFMLIFAWPIAVDEGAGPALIYSLVMLGIGFVTFVITLFITGPYYRSLKYEILEDEVIVRAGIITKSVKHVPYRTVTNLTVRRGILDRLFGLGSLSIQTAGMSGTNVPEERLVGLVNVQEVYEIVAAELRRFRSGMSPTQADSDMPVSDNSSPGVPQMDAVVEELKAIRALLEKK